MKNISQNGLAAFNLKAVKLTIWFNGLLLLLISTSSCKKFVEINPPTTLIASSVVYENDASASSAMNSIYSNMISNQSGLSSGNASVSYLMGLASDELINYSTYNVANAQFYANALSSSSSGYSNYYFWTELYNEIHVCNAVLEGVENSKGISASVKQQLIGEAKFMRAFLQFYAVNLYGDVPLVTSTDYRVNNTITRSPILTVYQQIVNDLLDAQAKLSQNFVDGSGNASTLRIRPNKVAATALLARVYLYLGNLTKDASNYKNAEIQATSVINSANYSLVQNLDDVFLTSSTEAIWQLQSIIPGFNAYEAYFFILTSPPGDGQVAVSLRPNLISTFESGDARLTHWIGTFENDGKTYYYPYKYKVAGDGYTPIPVTEYTIVLRLSEQYLIRAESRAEQGNLNGGKTDMNIIRHRAGLGDYSGASDQSSILNAVLHERQVELFTEWGHRWFDLKRTGNINSVMGSPGNVCTQKGGTWASYKMLLPLPLSETQINPNLKQNPGYN